ncbi:Dephospho-CoA kinase [hydrothermal vent metagenome]|uniref:Dephospho-CoA kinase n=1 Tax=hydrothermal vent metagenome TaxID=652676 RepID=A0A1W1BDS3_9ZZZZ
MIKAFRYAIVLTGGIATGKSTVLNFFTKWNFSFIDADRVAHQILQQENKNIAKLFGLEYVIDNKVNRKALGKLIFANPKERKKLENFIHPLIYREIEHQSMRLDILKRPYIIDIPLFFESNRYTIERSIVVYTPKQKQLERLIKRNGFSKREAEQRIEAQMDIELKREKATYLIDNSGDLKTLQEECVKVKEKILSDFK